MKILFVTTISNTVNSFLIPHIEFLLKQGHHVDIACNIVRDINSCLSQQGCKIYKLEFQRSPLKYKNYFAYKKLKKLVMDEKYDLVHTHTPVASAFVRFACRKIKNVKVIYTAHGFHFYNSAPLRNWMLYYPIEKWLSRYTDIIITINKEDYVIAKKSFKARKVEYIPGIGLDINKFSNVVINKSEKRRELGVPKDAFVLLSVGELNKNKNHEVIIKAIANMDNPKAYYIICGKGDEEKNLKKLSEVLGIGDRVKMLGYRNDVNEIYKVADVFVFPSYREGLPVSLMEAMVAELPIVCSDIRGNNDLIENEKNGYLVKANDVDGFTRAIEKLYKVRKIMKEFVEINNDKVKMYSIKNIIKKMEDIYLSYLQNT